MSGSVTSECGRFLPFELNYLPKKIKEKAKKELGETDEVRASALKCIKKLMKDDTRLKCPMDDNYILIYLRRSKFNVDKTFNQLTKGIQIKTRSGLFEPTNFHKLRSLIEDKFVCISPYRDSDGAIIGIIELNKWNPQKYSAEEIIAAICQLAFGCADMHEATQICGMKCILDPQGMGFDHLKFVTIKLLKYIYLGSTNVFPIRICGVHIINGNSFVYYAWNIFKYWVSQKIRRRVVIHSENVESLLNYFDPKLLPAHFGGTMNYDVNKSLKIFDETKDRYEYMWSASYDS